MNEHLIMLKDLKTDMMNAMNLYVPCLQEVELDDKVPTNNNDEKSTANLARTMMYLANSILKDKASGRCK